jgi:hypothetical protein
MKKIDERILNSFQIFSNWIWSIAPISCFMIARILMLVAAVFDFFRQWNQPEFAERCFGFGVMLFFFPWCYLLVAEVEKQYNPKFRNFARISLYYSRIFWSLILIFWCGTFLPFIISSHMSYTEVSILISDSCLWALFYFVSCDIPPPVERRKMVLNFNAA